MGLSPCNGVTSQQEAKVAPLPDRIDALNSSLDPWERTGLRHKPGRLISARQCELRLQTEGTLPAFGFDSQSPSVARSSLTQVGNLLPDVLGRLPHR